MANHKTMPKIVILVLFASFFAENAIKKAGYVLFQDENVSICPIIDDGFSFFAQSLRLCLFAALLDLCKALFAGLITAVL